MQSNDLHAHDDGTTTSNVFSPTDVALDIYFKIENYVSNRKKMKTANQQLPNR